MGKKHDLDMEEKENEGDDRELDGKRLDLALQIGTAAFERAFLGRIGLFRAEEGVQKKHDDTQETENRKNNEQLGHDAFSTRENSIQSGRHLQMALVVEPCEGLIWAFLGEEKTPSLQERTIKLLWPGS